MSSRLEEEACRRLRKLVTQQGSEVMMAGLEGPDIEAYWSLMEDFMKWFIERSEKLPIDHFRLFMVHVQQLLEILLEK